MSQQRAAATNHIFLTRGWHVAGTCTWDTLSSDKVTLRTHKQVPYVWTTHDFAAAACVCGMSLRHNPSCARNLREHFAAERARDGDEYEFPNLLSMHWITGDKCIALNLLSMHWITGDKCIALDANLATIVSDSPGKRRRSVRALGTQLI